jgi:murein DD-endopeptidase MepM/ murein hydrolase activator NlpD
MSSSFKKLVSQHKVSLHNLFPSLDFIDVAIPDMSVNNAFFGEDTQHENIEAAIEKIEVFQAKHPNSLLANGYLEERAFYNTKRFERQGNNGVEFRNIHLGVDFWVPAQTSVAAIFDAEVVISHHNDFHKDYGPLLILKHKLKQLEFYTLYGHLTLESLNLSPKGTKIKKGEVFAQIGDENENGHWAPHLHLQLITDLLGETENYNGVAFPSEIEKWKKLCPNPSLLFTEEF